jgi:anti-sigma regulatory factor (Ser/Thr protein kinase)
VLARLAGEQEIALRSLFSATPPAVTGEQDLVGAVQQLASSRVEISVPAGAVLLPASDVDELVAVVREALANTARHGGPEARSWILIEDLGEEVVLTVRDNGLGVEYGQRIWEAPLPSIPAPVREPNGRCGWPASGPASFDDSALR